MNRSGLTFRCIARVNSCRACPRLYSVQYCRNLPYTRDDKLVANNNNLEENAFLGPFIYSLHHLVIRLDGCVIALVEMSSLFADPSRIMPKLDLPPVIVSSVPRAVSILERNSPLFPLSLCLP